MMAARQFQQPQTFIHASLGQRDLRQLHQRVEMIRPLGEKPFQPRGGFVKQALHPQLFGCSYYL